MRIDLHTHTNVSDGTDAPAELVSKAARAGLSVVALTDHDTFDGWSEASARAVAAGVTLVLGMEMSTRLDGKSVHLLAYLPDPSYPPLADELERIRTGRSDRIAAMVGQLTEHGMPLGYDDVRGQAGEAASLGKPHVAGALIAKGYVQSLAEAFEQLLAPGRPGYVARYAPESADAVALVRDAGGVPVLAHPWGRGTHAALDEDRLAMLAAAGLAGLEVDHDDHDDDARRRLREIAHDLDLIVTGSSDHHGAGKEGHHLGMCTTVPDQYERLVALAEANAKTAGRDAPRPVQP